MNFRKRVLFSLALLVLSIVLTFCAVTAWFVFSIRSNYLFVLSGNIDLQCEVYVAIDELDSSGLKKPDGIPDIIQFPPHLPLSRSEILASYYQTMLEAKNANKTNPNGDGTDSFKSIYVGRQLLYKIVLTNQSSTRADALINVCFADMTSYMADCLRLMLTGQTQVFDEYFASFSPRLLFNIRSRAVKLYNRGEDGKFDTASQSQQSQSELFEASYVPLWAYSRGEGADEYFVKGARLDYGSLLEIDFALSCDFLTDEFNNYIAAAPTLYSQKLASGEFDSYPIDEIKAAISQIAVKEALYVATDRIDQTKHLTFEISSIIIKGEQRPHD